MTRGSPPFSLARERASYTDVTSRQSDPPGRKDTTPMLRPTAIALILSLVALLPAHAETPKPVCNPYAGSSNMKIACLAKIVSAQAQLIASLEQRLGQTANAAGYLTESELDAHLSGYVKYNSAIAINALVEPSGSQSDGRCLESYFDDVAVIAHKPCSFLAKKELRWQLLRATPDERAHDR